MDKETINFTKDNKSKDLMRFFSDLGFDKYKSLKHVKNIENLINQDYQKTLFINNEKNVPSHYETLFLMVIKKTLNTDSYVFNIQENIFKDNLSFKEFLKEKNQNSGTKTMILNYSDCKKEINDILNSSIDKNEKERLNKESSNLKENLDLIFNYVLSNQFYFYFYGFPTKIRKKIDTYFNCSSDYTLTFSKEIDFKFILDLFSEKAEEYNVSIQEDYKKYLFAFFYQYLLNNSEKSFHTFYFNLISLFSDKENSIFKNEDFGVIPFSERVKSINVDKYFEDLVGFDNIKDEFNKIKAFINLKEVMAIHKNTFLDMRFHLILTGNPGTGKTTIAEKYSEFLRDIFLDDKQFIKTTAEDYVSKWVGDSVLKTSNIINELKGNIIFIDEAYAISLNTHGQEALSVIVKEMEENKSDTIFIFAGYQKEMTDFLNANSGIKSRVQFNFNINDYSSEEMFEILKLKISNSGFEISKKTEEFYMNKIKEREQNKNLGNGRYIENLVNEMILLHSMDILENDSDFNIIDISSDDLFLKDVS